jgi:hypothetical protein
MPSAVDILVRLRTSTSNGLIDLHVALRGLESDASASDRALRNLRAGLVSLAPAAIPVAAVAVAALGPLVAQLGAASIAAGAFTAAVIPQAAALSDAAKAQQKATEATTKYGPASKQATAAQNEYQALLAKMPPATRQAAAAFSNLTVAYKGWSNSLASSTMPVAVKSFAVLEAILPRLTPLVQGASDQFDRLVTAMAGATQSAGFDKLNREFDQFANRALKKTVDEVLHFSRVLSQGDFNKGPLHEFFAYAKQNGPLVRDTMKNLVEALAHLGRAASDAGPGMLTIVNALAKLVNAVPAPVLTRLLQLYTALRLLKGTAAGVQIVAGSLGNLTRQLGTMANAASNAGGGLAGVRAALATLSTGTKVAGVIAVIAGIALALKALSGSGKAAPDVQRLTSAIGELGRTGQVSGEAARVFGKDFDDLNYAIGRLNGRRSGMDAFNDTMNKVFTLGMGKSNSAKNAAKDLDGVDKALADLVQNGNANLAAAALKRLTDEYTKAGHPASDLTGKLDDYKSALADAKFEQELTADSMGLFGKQAQATQKTLEAQKQSADGLRQSIQALNDANRAGIDGMIGFEQAIADAAKAAKDNGSALHMVNGQLDLSSQKARDEASSLDDLAAKTDAATSAARDQGKSWQDVNTIYARGRDALIRTARQMGLTTQQAKTLADQILKTPDKTARLRGNMEDLRKKVASAKAQLKSVPASKTTAIRGNIAQLQNVIRDAQAEIAALQGKTIVIRSTYVSGIGNVSHEGGGYAHGGIIGAASGGPRSRMTLVGEQGPELVDLAAGSRVHTANQTRQMLATGGGVSGQPIALTVVIGGTTVGTALIDPLRKEIRNQGGNVQIVLGQKGK